MSTRFPPVQQSPKVPRDPHSTAWEGRALDGSGLDWVPRGHLPGADARMQGEISRSLSSRSGFGKVHRLGRHHAMRQMGLGWF